MLRKISRNIGYDRAKEMMEADAMDKIVWCVGVGVGGNDSGCDGSWVKVGNGRG